MRIRHTIRQCLLAALCLVVSSLFAACGGQGGGDVHTTGIPPDHSSVGVPPIVLHDPSPGQLEAFVDVTMGGYDPTSRELTHIAFIFSSNGHPVQFAGHEQLVCNGKAISLHNPQAQNIEGATSALAGQTFHCTYSASHASAALTFTVPRAPAIRSPHEQAQVPRSKNTIVAYDTQGGTLMGMVALTRSGKAIARLDTPGAGQATIDTSAFPAGAGSISLTETLNFRATQSGTAFASLKTGGMGIAMIEVNWV
jgi:hypothetical protein